MSSVMAPLVVEKIPAAPKVAAPIALFKIWEFSLHFVGRAALHQTHQVTDGQLWRDRHEHVDMVARQHSSDDLDAVLSTDLAADVTNPQLNVALQHLVAILGRPNDAPLVTLLRNALPVKG